MNSTDVTKSMTPGQKAARTRRSKQQEAYANRIRFAADALRARLKEDCVLTFTVFHTYTAQDGVPVDKALVMDLVNRHLLRKNADGHYVADTTEAHATRLAEKEREAATNKDDRLKRWRDKITACGIVRFAKVEELNDVLTRIASFGGAGSLTDPKMEDDWI